MSEQNGTGLTRLMEAFPAEAVGKLPRIICEDCSKKRCNNHKRERCKDCGAYVGKHIHLDYVGHADVTFRLLEVDPAWQWEPVGTDEHGLPLLDTDDRGNPVGLWIRLTVCGVTRLGYGSCPSNQNDAVKVLIGDALRNAAMRFGAALDLWAKGDRADPAAENAVAAGGRAERRRPQQQAPAEQRTDHEWLSGMERRIDTADSRPELSSLALEVKAKQRVGRCEQVHYDHLVELGLRRQKELDGKPTLPRNKDGSISRSQLSDEERSAAGLATREEAKEMGRRERDTLAEPKKAERVNGPVEDDPWATPGGEPGDEPEWTT